MNKFKELRVWQKSISLVTDIYISTKKFPSNEIYGLTSQVRRSVISIPSNIAEGAGRKSKKEFSRFLEIAYSSSFELETQLIIATKLNYLNNDENLILQDRLTEIQKMLYKLMNTLK